MTKNSSPDKYSYSEYGIDFRHVDFFQGQMVVELVIIFGADISLSMHADKNKKFSLILGEDQMLGSDDTKLTTEKEYAISFTG